MKGLLIKDWYMTKKYCRSYFLIAAMFICVSAVNRSNLFFVFYPCVFCGMVPVTLLSYDERSHWLQYSATLPYKREQIVSGKYIVGLAAQLAVLILTGIVQAVKANIDGDFVAGDFLVMMLLLLTVSSFSASIALPFIFKLGVEKGRIAYYVMIGFACAACIIAADIFKTESQIEIQPNFVLILMALGGICLYALSWYLSIVFFKKRDL